MDCSLVDETMHLQPLGFPTRRKTIMLAMAILAPHQLGRKLWIEIDVYTWNNAIFYRKNLGNHQFLVLLCCITRVSVPFWRFLFLPVRGPEWNRVSWRHCMATRRLLKTFHLYQTVYPKSSNLHPGLAVSLPRDISNFHLWIAIIMDLWSNMIEPWQSYNWWESCASSPG